MGLEVVGERNVSGEYWGSLGSQPDSVDITAVVNVGGVVGGEGGWWIRIWWGRDGRCRVVTYDAVTSFQERVYDLFNVD
jgi:hypothetical protein